MAPRALSRGMNGSDVERLQADLSAKGYEVSVNGNFDEYTENAVKSFQKDNGLNVDGVVGAETGMKLGAPV
ncbi:putative peptidoglycan-binding domain-containing protein [Rivularia sp. PCC 7116]|uniref:peptidoglycan-binding domain-containing protein n=1 Tax=Rivularia sp. PCC 7116 TaxID=373994 RepID=UPI00029ECDFB|nr:peptidoglycan-binding domain-containing protein [Rivularia sp. PCC 7116]AFY56902.1 putative peptidoglycan-binding domain-containing protein [Rivularia sp. PCC 7116]